MRNGCQPLTLAVVQQTGLGRSHDSADRGAWAQGFISCLPQNVCQDGVDADANKLDENRPSNQTPHHYGRSPFDHLFSSPYIHLTLSLSLCLFSPLSLLHSQMSDHRPGTWHTSFCLLSFSNSLSSSPPPFFFCNYLHTCTRACTQSLLPLIP